MNYREPPNDDLLVCFSSADGVLSGLRVSTGELCWTRPIPTRRKPTMALTVDRVVIATEDGELYCVDRHDGRALWQQRVSSSSMIKHEALLGIFSDRIVVCHRGSLRCYDLDGELQWSGSRRVAAMGMPGCVVEYREPV